MATKTYVLGMNAKLYYGSDDANLASMTELGNVRDVTLTMETGEADITTRGNSGWRATAPTLKECTIEFEQVWKPGDAGFEAIKNAWYNSTTLELAPLSESRETSGAEGPKGRFSITNFSRNEPLEEAVTVSVTAKLAAFSEWVDV